MGPVKLLYICSGDFKLQFNKLHSLFERFLVRCSSYKLYTDKCSKFKCISHHPIQKEYFITGSVQGKVQLWDSRYISSVNKKLSPLHEFTTSMGVLSSYFSPITGDKILACASGNEMT